jgi:UDP-N-acetylmuramate--alanine ligase
MSSPLRLSARDGWSALSYSPSSLTSTQGIAVGGTSGKSTVTGMIGWIFHALGRDPTVMNGAVMKNFMTPDTPFASSLVGHGTAFISEVDESDGSTTQT